MRRAALRLGAVALATAMLGACTEAGTRSPGAAAPATGPVWPAPPAAARIGFVATIQGPEDIGATRSGLAGFMAFLKGEEMPRLVQPFGLTVDRQGRLYVVDKASRRVYVFDPANGVYGAFPGEADGTIESPIDVTVADDGRAFVSDSKAGVVHVFTPPRWEHVRSFGKGQLERPTGLAINRHRGELLVVDTLNERLAVFDLENLSLRRVVGGPGTGEQQFHYPTNVAVDPSGRVLVTDALNFRVQILDAEYRFTTTFGSAGDGPGHFSRPKGLGTDEDGNVYVVDALFDNVQIFDRDGRLLLAFGSPGSGNGQFWLPSGIAVGPHGRIYVADTYNQRVQVFERLGTGAR